MEGTTLQGVARRLQEAMSVTLVGLEGRGVRWWGGNSQAASRPIAAGGVVSLKVSARVR